MLVDQQFPDDSNFDFNDPKAVDGLLAREMQQLDVKERNLLLEDAHGISSGNPAETLWVETPETIHKALNDLAEAINRIPSREKQAYLESTKLPSSYIHSKRFRLKCLRCTGFNIPFAADKVVSYCEVARNLFGGFILQRPVRLSDFNKRDLQFMRMGRLQYMPFGDRAGRRILVFFPDETQEAMPPLSKARISFYMFWVAGDDDDYVQRKGIVVVAWFDKEFKISKVPKQRSLQDYKLCCIRTCAIHVCTPDTPLFRFRSAVASLRLGRARKYMRQHLGNSMENRYKLQSYGIPVDGLPISYHGKIKLGYVRQWIGVRSVIESYQYDRMGLNAVPIQNEIIEYPQPEDVVFRQGSSSTSHPANQEFRDFIMAKVNEQELSMRNTLGVKIRRKKMVMDIIQEVRFARGGRFLIWNENGGWNELLDEQMIQSKIEYLIKEFRKSMRKSHHHMIPSAATSQSGPKPLVLKSDTSIFRSNYRETMAKHTLPYSLEYEVNENQLLEAACCIAQCFDLPDAPKSM